MARISSPEQIVIEVHQSLGLERPASKHIKQFTHMAFPLPRQKAFMHDLLQDIFVALEMDDQARSDALRGIDEWFAFDRSVAAHTWTHAASHQQVLWHLLAYSWVPGLARRLAFWSLAGFQRGIPFDAGMPGGSFWFLPTWDEAAGTVQLPVEGVLEWLLDLLGDQSLEQAANALQHEQGRRKNMNALRTLHGWRLEGRLPQSAKIIDELFHDGAGLDFQGSFDLPAADSIDEQFAAAIAFVQRKQLAAGMLAYEIPLHADVLHKIVDGSGTAAEKHAFVHALAVRYAAPSMRTVRQRLRIARMTQDAYQRLLKTLCGPSVTPDCADPSQNKLLPLLSLFHVIYNLTIEASGHGKTDAEQDSWFESRLAPWDRCDLLLSITPSARGLGYRLLGERLTRQFMALAPGAPLPDLIPFSEPEQASSVMLTRLAMLQSESDEDERIDALRKAAMTLPVPGVLEALQAEDSRLVLGQLAVTGTLPLAARTMAIDRMRELATEPDQVAETVVAELSLLFDHSAAKGANDTQSRTAILLGQLDACDQKRTWKAPFLRYRARHRLMLNDFEGAVEDYRSALEACFERNYGMLHSDIASEGFATEVALRGMDRKSQDYWHRHLVHSVNGTGAFEDTAVRSEEYFWEHLYRPYDGVEPQHGRVTTDVKELLIRSMDVIHDGDINGLRSWLLRHEKKLRRLRIKDVRSDSVLLLWMKQLTHLEQMAKLAESLGALRPGLPHPGTAMRKAVRLLVDVWPEQARTYDFKRQTPLMIAADNGDAELTMVLAGKSDADAQDWLGRTALHAAVTGGSSRCVELVLDLNPNVEAVTIDDGQSALHTAVRCGNPKAVTLVADAFPCRLVKTNTEGLAPLDMARDLLEHYTEWRDFMGRHKRRIGSKEDFKAIIAYLESLSA